MIAPNGLPSRALESLILAIARDQPHRLGSILAWLVSVQQVKLSPAVFDRALVIVLRSPLLSEPQKIKRFLQLRRLLNEQSQVQLSRSSIIALVNVFIEGLTRHKRGNLLGLKWALSMAKKAKVSHSVFKSWARQLVSVQDMRRQ